MKQKLLIAIASCFTFILLASLGTKDKTTKNPHYKGKPFYSSAAPAGYTGEFGFNCTGCHGSFALNSGGGNVTVTGLPTGGIVPGQAYPISITITHGSANRTRWGFALASRNTAGVEVGNFTSTNPNAALIGTAEIGHLGAVVTPAGNTYTYTNINWVAPINPSAADLNINFFVVGVAANNNSSTSGDYVHSALINRTYINLPIELTKFTGSLNNKNEVALQWATTQEVNSASFEIERSTDGQNFTKIGIVTASGNSSIARNYTFEDKFPPFAESAKSFYRLKQLDRDGTFAYSNTVSLKLKANKSFMEAPIPNLLSKGGATTVRFFAEKAMPLQIAVTDALGKTVYTNKQQANAGFNMLNIPATAFANSAGVYYLTVKGTDFKKTERIVIK